MQQGTRVWLGCLCREGVEQLFSFYKRPPVSINESGCQILRPGFWRQIQKSAFKWKDTSFGIARGRKGNFKRTN